MATTAHSGELERLTTGIAGLDAVLGGGLIAGRSCLVVGPPGAGKTTLGNQIVHSKAHAGAAALYVTLLAETHDRMLGNLAGFAFFDPSLVGDRVHYVSLTDELIEHGLPAILARLRDLVLRHRAAILILDGSNRLADFAPSHLEQERFMADLLNQLGVLSCTALLLANPTTGLLAETGTHADAILELGSDLAGAREERYLRVVKCRGTAHLLGRHQLAITAAGMEVYPRLEALTASAPPRPAPLERDRRPFGIPGLDGMVGGGVLSGSTTLVLGPVGSGKTLTGLHFIAAGADRGEAGLIVTFQESPARLIAKAREVGLDLARHAAEGRVRFLWYPSHELLLDAWAHELLAATAEFRPGRLLIDTITDIEALSADPARLPAVTAALVNTLSGQGVTSLFNVGLRTISGGELALPIPSIAGAIENVIVLRYLERGARLRRLVSILKSGESHYDSGVREFVIGEDGMDVAGSIASADEMLKPSSQAGSASPAPSRRRPRGVG